MVSAGPSQAVLVYEVFDYVDVDDKSAPYTRSYRQLTPDVELDAEVSFNNGATWVAASNRVMLNIPLLARGNQLVVRFTRTSDIDVRGRLYVGSWAVVY
jgi:hypothetical protein